MIDTIVWMLVVSVVSCVFAFLRGRHVGFLEACDKFDGDLDRLRERVDDFVSPMGNKTPTE